MNLPIRRIDTPPETSVLGVRTHAANVESAKAVFLSALKRHAKGYVCFSCVHGVMEAQRDRELKRIYDGALLVAPDGMPLAWVGKLQGFRTMERVAGPEMMLELMASEDFRKYSHFLCGGEPGMAEDLRDRLTQRFPGVNICGVFTPPFRAMRADEERELIETVHRVQPDIVWVGLGAPKQEKFMARYLPLLDTTLMMGVGAAFLFHTGRIKDSPLWVKRSGLQWLHRLLQEPCRLWRRYLLRNPSFMVRVTFQLISEAYQRRRPGEARALQIKDLETMPRSS